MENPTQADTGQIDVALRCKARLQARDWLWRPRYAKLWWLSTVVYWAGMALSFYIRPMKDFYSTAFAGFLNIGFYPPVILMILGFGYVRAKLDNGDWVLTYRTSLSLPPERSVGGFLDPMADPLDPRSPLYQRRHHNH